MVPTSYTYLSRYVAKRTAWSRRVPDIVPCMSADANYRSDLDANCEVAINDLDLAAFRTHFETTLP
jgi:hypothetical protein